MLQNVFPDVAHNLDSTHKATDLETIFCMVVVNRYVKVTHGAIRISTLGTGGTG